VGLYFSTINPDKQEIKGFFTAEKQLWAGQECSTPNKTGMEQG
jgi:hypothetical protein